LPVQITAASRLIVQIEQIVHRLAQLGSMRSILLWLSREGLQLPHQIHRRGLGTQIA
jgi:hypothetical protein